MLALSDKLGLCNSLFRPCGLVTSVGLPISVVWDLDTHPHLLRFRRCFSVRYFIASPPRFAIAAQGVAPCCAYYLRTVEHYKHPLVASTPASNSSRLALHVLKGVIIGLSLDSLGNRDSPFPVSCPILLHADECAQL